MIIKTNSDNGTIIGDYLPAKITTDTVLIIFHGYFSSNRSGPAKLYDEIASLISYMGIDVFKFDSTGFGDSEGEFSKSNYDTHLVDQEVAVSYALSKRTYKYILFLGHSMGCSIAARIAYKYHFVDKLILLSPALSYPTYPYKLFTPFQWNELNQLGYTNRKGLKVNNYTIKKMFDEENTELLEKIKTDSIVILPDNDQFYSNNDLEKATNGLQNKMTIKIKNADHNFIPKRTRSLMFELLKGNIAPNKLEEPISNPHAGY